MRRIYFDYAASTPMDPRVLAAMQPYFSVAFGNPGSLHSFGQEAIAAVDASREKIGGLIGARHFREVVFTGSATEANNLALRGSVELYKKNNPSKTPRVIVSSIEHESVLETARTLEGEGVEVVHLPVKNDGVIDLDALASLFNESTVIVSIMYVNNEIGTIQPLAAIAQMIAEFKVRAGTVVYPLFHTDAAQAFPFLDCNVDALGVDMMTLSAHKTYGPKGIGALYVRRRRSASSDSIPLVPQITGGGQEFGIRSGTENVPNIVGFATAAALAARERKKESLRISALRAKLFSSIKKIMPEAEMNGPELSAAAAAPHILNVYFPGNDAQDILTKFDRAGLAASSGSACRSRAAEESYVITALGYANS